MSQKTPPEQPFRSGALKDPRLAKADFPKQRQDWPGLACRMDPLPDHGEESYRGTGRLKGRRALITGGDSGIGDTIEQAVVPVTENTVEDYDVFDGLFEGETITEGDAQATEILEGSVGTGPGVFKATDLIGDYAYLSDGGRYGYIADVLVEDGAVAAIMTDPASYGRWGYYAYPS